MGYIKGSEGPSASLPPRGLEVSQFATLSQPSTDHKLSKITQAGWIDLTHVRKVDQRNSGDNTHRPKSVATPSFPPATIPIRVLAWKRRDHLNLDNQTIAECSVR